MKKWLSLFSALALTVVMCIGMGVGVCIGAAFDAANKKKAEEAPEDESGADAEDEPKE